MHIKLQNVHQRTHTVPLPVFDVLQHFFLGQHFNDFLDFDEILQRSFALHHRYFAVEVAVIFANGFVLFLQDGLHLLAAVRSHLFKLLF
jgi:hypothetical protein